MTSIDNEELGKFNKTMEEWWDLEGEFKLLHKINPVRLEYIIGKIENHFNGHSNGHFKDSKKPSDLKLLDVGCGGGLMSIPLAKKGFKVTGIDANESNVIASNAAAKSYLSVNAGEFGPGSSKDEINFQHITAEELLNHQKGDEGFDVILALEIIEHVAGPKEFLFNLSKLLNPGGMIIVSTLNRTIKSYMLAIVMAEYVLGWVPKKTHDYSKFIKPSEIHNMLKNSDLSLKELKGMVLDLPSNQWKLTSDIDVNYFAYLA